MCVHYWMIDNANKGICKKCGAVHDYRPELDKLFGVTKGLSSRAKLHLSIDLCTNAGYAVQGSYRGQTYKISDYNFTVDNTDTL